MSDRSGDGPRAFNVNTNVHASTMPPHFVSQRGPVSAPSLLNMGQRKAGFIR
jgi:hypothetical protein